MPSQNHGLAGRWACAVALLLAGPITGLSQPVAPRYIRPTVTAADGDPGGTCFGDVPDAARVHRYYIAAEVEPWDFAPSGREELCGSTLPPSVIAQRISYKFRYVRYTDGTFTTKVPAARSLGILGPVLRGAVGDFLVVTFLNRTSMPLSMHPHGVRYDHDSEGAYYGDAPGRGAAIGAGGRFTYVWQLDASSGPLPGEPSSKAWLYHSHVNPGEEINLGLVGCIIVTDPHRARTDGTPADVDREFATLFMIFDESGTTRAEREAAEYADPAHPPPGPTWAQLQERAERGSRYAINGRIFGNLQGLEMNQGERVRWYLFALGSEQDLHTAHWHGARVIEEGRRRTDAVELLPASMKVADMIADNSGIWLFECHVAEHMREGMSAPFVVFGPGVVGVDRSPEHAFLGMTRTPATTVP